MSLPVRGTPNSVGQIGMFLVATLFVGGCGKAPLAMSTVSGRVLLDGKPLPGGRVSFVPVDPLASEAGAGAALDETGAYQVSLPVGEVMVLVDNREIKPRPPRAQPGALSKMPPEIRAKMRGSDTASPGPPPGAVGRYVEIPVRYYMAETSNLGFKVEAGSMTHDIELKSQ